MVEAIVILLSIIAILAAIWWERRDRQEDPDRQRVERKAQHLTRLEKSIKRLSEELKDV